MKRSVSIFMTLCVVALFAVPLAAGNLVQNGEFDDGLNGWGGWIDNAKANVTVSLDETGQLSGANSMKVEVVTGSADVWRVQRNQRIPLLAGHTYAASFMAKAEATPAKVVVYSQHEADPWTNHLNQTIELTTEPTLYGPFEFSPAFDDDINNFGFWFGGQDNVTVYVDAVVLVDKSAPSGPKILWISSGTTDPDGKPWDQAWVDLLTAQGYTVQREDGTMKGTLTPDQLAVLNSADLIIQSRTIGSGDYNDPAGWNSVTTPIMITSAYLTRQNRYQWFGNSDLVGDGNSGAPAYLVEQPSHPIFTGVAVPGDKKLAVLDGSVGSGHTSLPKVTDVGNGQMLASVADGGTAAVVYWPQGTKFHDGTEFVATADRMFFACGTRESTLTPPDPQHGWGMYNLTPQGEKVFLNSVKFLLGIEIPPPPPVENVPQVFHASHPPAIDGKLDPIWKHAQWVREYVYPSGATTFNDAALSWRAMWDNDYLYLFVTIVDDVFLAEDGVSWHGDSVELWLDGDNSKAAAYDGVNDLGYNFYYTNDPANPLIFKPGTEGKLNTTGHLQGAAYTEWGVDLELAIPMKNLGITPTPGHLMGMDVDWNDNDEANNNRETKVKWFDATDNSWQYPNLMGTIQLAERTIYDYTDVWYTDAAPVIDGTPDDMSKFPTFELNQYMSEVAKLENWDKDAKLQYQVVWDEKAVYYQVHIKDDVLVQDGAYDHTDDGLELWFDGDNSRKTAYDGINDIGARFGYVPGGGLDSLMVFGWGGSGHYIWGPGTIDFASSPTEDGLFLEFAVSMDTLGMKPQNGYMFAHELDYNDDDDGGGRDTKLKTHSIVDDTWINPSYMSSAKLMGGPGAPVAEEVVGLYIDMTAVPPVIDGDFDLQWHNARNYQVAKFGPEDWWDSYANFRVLYDAKNFYMFVEVHDDVINTEHANDYERDCVELFLDGNNSKNVMPPDNPWAWPPVAYDADDAQFRFVFDAAPWVNKEGYDLSAIEYAYKETENGWNLEFAMPWKNQPFKGAEGLKIGFDVSVGDNDGANREHISNWWADNGDAWHNPSVFGTAQFTGRKINEKTSKQTWERLLPIPFTAYPVKIDGEPDFGWHDVATVFSNMRMNNSGKKEYLSHPLDAQVEWKAMWDFNNLYLLIDVVDDIFLQEGGKSWQDDGIEIWFDGNASMKTSYTDANDLSFAMAYNPDTILDRITNWRGSLPADKMDLIQQAQKVTDHGLRVELALPMSVLGVEAADGSLVAIEVDYNDSDTPGLDRDTKLKSYDPTDNTWQNPSLLGLARLVGSVVKSDVENQPVQIVTDYELKQNYPNPFNPSTTIEFALPIAGKVKLAVYDVLGREVANLIDAKFDAGIHSVTFDAAHLSSGVYFYRLQTPERVITKKLMLIK